MRRKKVRGEEERGKEVNGKSEGRKRNVGTSSLNKREEHKNCGKEYH